MKHWRLIVFVLFALAQLAAPASLIWKRENTLRKGSVWKFRTAPVDPVDAFRGRYISLQFDIETQEAVPSAALIDRENVFVILKADTEGFAAVDQVLVGRPAGDDFMEARLVGRTISLPFHTYWVTERDAPAAEGAYRAESRPGRRNAYVTVRVFRGDAALEQLYLDNQPLGDYLRQNVTAK
jgi:uncharacterized membrane-anchored protein